MKNNLASFIDHTLLKPVCLKKDIEKLCNEAMEFGFYSVCIPPCYVSFAKNILRPSLVKVSTVVGFPLGLQTPLTKKNEAIEAIKNGADELDMVLNLSFLKSGLYEELEKDISNVVKITSTQIVKVILETCYLTDLEKIKACQVSHKACAHFVKTSTGFASEGATLGDIKLLKDTVGDFMKIKASGGIKTRKMALKMIEAGASRLGTSLGVQIVTS